MARIGDGADWTRDMATHDRSGKPLSYLQDAVGLRLVDRSGRRLAVGLVINLAGLTCAVAALAS